MKITMSLECSLDIRSKTAFETGKYFFSVFLMSQLVNFQ